MTSGASNGVRGLPEEEPDAFSPGWVQPMGRGREEALFVLAGSSLGIGRTATTDAPVWIDLERIRNVDALGDPADDTIEVELTLDDGRTIAARWNESFCDRVLSALVAGLEAAAPTGSPEPPPHAQPAVPQAPVPQPPAPEHVAPAPVEPVVLPSVLLTGQVPPPIPPGTVLQPGPSALQPEPSMFEPLSASAPRPDQHADLPIATSSAPGPDSEPDSFSFAAVTSLPEGPLPGEKAVPPGLVPAAGTSALVLEDVVYLRGYPGQNKKRKKCVATLTDEAIDLQGPGGLSFRVAWDAVQTVEAQNSDEARFRMNTKIHRDATLLVVACQQDVTILLEARDCPTIPLRSAISQLVSDLRVVVV